MVIKVNEKSKRNKKWIKYMKKDLFINSNLIKYRKSHLYLVLVLVLVLVNKSQVCQVWVHQVGIRLCD